MADVDITCDLMEEDETGFVWTFLHEAPQPHEIEVGALIGAGDADDPFEARVVDIVTGSCGRRIVHLNLLS